MISQHVNCPSGPFIASVGPVNKWAFVKKRGRPEGLTPKT